MSDAYDYYSTTEVSARLDLVRHLIENSEMVPLVRGPSGVGKTLLASRIQQLAPENWSVCHFEADPTMQPERLLATLARCCGLPDIAGELLQRLVDRFEVLRKRGRIPVLLVDDAQMLPPTSLITLLRLFERQLDGVRLVSIVLFADEQIDLLLSTPQLQIMSPQAIQVIDMPTMSRQEATAFMQFLLKNEGLSHNLALDEAKLNRIYKETGGNPGLLASAILNAVGEDGDKKGSGLYLSGYRKQLLIGGIPLVLLMFALLFLGPIKSLFEPGIDTNPEKNSAREIKPLPAPSSSLRSEQPVVETAQNDMASLQKIETVAEQTHEDEGALIVEEQLVSVEKPLQTTKPNGDSKSMVESETTTTSAQTLERAQSEGADDSSAEIAASGRTSAEAAHEVETAAVQQSVADEADVKAVDRQRKRPDTAIEQVPEEINVATGDNTRTTEPAEVKQETEARQTAVPAETAAEVSTPAEKKSEGDEALKWVMSRSPGSYTLQLVAVENLESLKRYVETNRLHEETHTFEMVRNGNPWYALLWGDFPDRHSALQAASALPPTVQKGGVWARSFASLQRLKTQ
jgi:DamX protein